MRAVNLIPAEQRKGAGGAAGRSDGAAYVVIGLLAGFVALAGVYALSHKQVADRKAEVARLTSQSQAAVARANQLTAYMSFLALRDQRVSTVAQLAGSRFDWAHAFHELGRVLPFDVALTTVDGTIPSGAAPAGPPVPGAATASSVRPATPPGSVPTLAITGCTVSQSELAYTLTRLRLMDGVSGVELKSSNEATAAPGTTGSASSIGSGCPYTFQVDVTYAGLPSVSSPAPSAATPATATAATPPAGTTPTGGK